MFAAESERQVLLFVHQVLQFVPNVAGIIYDFACGVKLHINKQVLSLAQGFCLAQGGNRDETF